MCKICGKPKSAHITVLIRKNGLGSEVIEKRLKCPDHIAFYTEGEKDERQT